MANDDLVNFRNDLKDDFSDLWSDLEDAISSMKRNFDQSDRNDFRECINEGDRADTAPCLAEKADELGIGDAFRRTILSQDGLLSDLREGGRAAADSNNVSEAVRSSADYTSLSTLNKMCGNPNVDTSDIEDELSDDSLAVVGGSIDTFQDCVTATAEEQSLSKNLKEAYGTAS